MQEYRFNRRSRLPIIDARITGPRASHPIKLVFDTGSQFSIIDTVFVEEIGYSARDAIDSAVVSAATGEPQEGYLLKIDRLRVLGRDFESVKIGAFDFDQFEQFRAHGLLGWDVIRQFHLEMNGPAGVVKVFRSNS